jgi:methionyl-tRNA formyltransferase
MRVLFYGTPEFALPTLEALLRHHEVVGVVTQPDRPAHRGQRLTPPPVKVRASAAGLPILQPPRLRDPGWAERLHAFRPDVAVVVAFGQILPKSVLDVPALGSINVHASLLPKYRGAAPVAWAIMRGERVTGITTFQMDEGMDTGPVLIRSAPVPIGDDETAGELAARLALLGADVLIETLARLDALRPEPQPRDAATLAPRLKKSDGHLDWTRTARDLVNTVRGSNPWPGAVTGTPRGPLTIWRAQAVTDAPGRPRSPGLVVPYRDTLAVAASEGLVLPTQVQPESRRLVSWSDWLRGARLSDGTRFTPP